MAFRFIVIAMDSSLSVTRTQPVEHSTPIVPHTRLDSQSRAAPTPMNDPRPRFHAAQAT